MTFAVGSIGSAMMCYAIPYTPETLPAKMAAYGVFTTIMGITLAPVVLMGGKGMVFWGTFEVCVW